MEGPGKLVATLCLHSLHIGAMEGVKSKVLHFSIVLTTERVKDHSHSVTLQYMASQFDTTCRCTRLFFRGIKVHTLCVPD